MRKFDYYIITDALFSKNIVNVLSAIHEYKGSQSLIINSNSAIIRGLSTIAKIQSTQYSNKIEGIYTSDKRLKEIVEEKSDPMNRDEYEIAGYRDVLKLIHNNYEYMELTPNLILQLHRDLYKYSPSGYGGKFKNTDNVIVQVDVDGKDYVRFKPLSAFETPLAIDKICSNFNGEINKVDANPLLLISVFILDFLCIHPFNDGNGRISRLLTLLLLYQSNYDIGKYISIEMLIEKNKDRYYETLYQSSIDWNKGDNNYLPFVEYYLTIVLSAHKELSTRTSYLNDSNISKSLRIENLFNESVDILSKNDIMLKYPDISKITVERTLSNLIKEGKIVKIRSGKNTAYIKK